MLVVSGWGLHIVAVNYFDDVPGVGQAGLANIDIVVSGLGVIMVIRWNAGSLGCVIDQVFVIGVVTALLQPDLRPAARLIKVRPLHFAGLVACQVWSIVPGLTAIQFHSHIQITPLLLVDVYLVVGGLIPATADLDGLSAMDDLPGERTAGFDHHP